MSSYRLYVGDLPEDFQAKGSLAIDTETMGLQIGRDRLCLVQLCDEAGQVALVHFPTGGSYEAPHLKALLSDPSREKIFHFARFDLAAIYQALGLWCTPLFCTKIASRLARTYTSYHGLKNLCQELLGIELSKQEQSSDWGAETLTTSQKNYAASDVIHLHKLRSKLEAMLLREGRLNLALELFQGVKTRAHLDVLGWDQEDIFSHS